VRLIDLQKAATQVNAGEIALAIHQSQNTLSANTQTEKSVPEQIKMNVHQARVRAVAQVLSS
jgi:hypothetical protein